MSYSIPTAYVQGVQAKLIDAGALSYVNEKIAMEDAQQLGTGMDDNMSVDQGGLATEGASTGETQAVAAALVDMAEQAGEEAQMASAKADIVKDAISKVASLHQDEFTKFAEPSPGDNNTVAGHKPGKISAGEGSAKREDLNKELTNAVPATAERPAYWNSMPGGQKDEDKGHVGVESAGVGADGQGPVSKNLNKELVNAVSNTKERPNAHGGPGHQSDEDKGHVGTEKAASLSDILSQL
jgi:hypothetical protein